MSPCAGSVDCGSWVNALADIQRLVVRGINLQCGRWLLLRIDKPEQTRQFIAALLAKEWISNACIPSLVAEQEDVGIFLRALNDGSLLNDNEQAIYSSIYEYEHTGLIPGYFSIARYHSDIDTVVVQFVNTAGGTPIVPLFDTAGGTKVMVSKVVYNRIVRILRQ